MTRLAICVYLFLVPAWVLGSDVASEEKDRDHRLEEYPEAMSADELKRAREAEAKDQEIYMSLEDQAKMLDKLAEELAMMKDSHATMDDMEAPVIYLTPPVELPDEQMEADKEVEKLLMDTGLEGKPHSLPEDEFDPFKLTSMNEVMTALKKSKSTIDTLREKRNALLKTLRESAMYVATDHSKMLTYKAVNQELDEVDNLIEKETATLLKLEHVKKTLSKSHGTGHDIETEEADLEKREEEIAEGYDSDRGSDDESDKGYDSNEEL
ncbi:signal peptide containing protein, putative [Babesia ovata]|uniref:Signal peptide containing protein, putative n=1 Tax=Babesia ovata TaxID=189622 RepID=A0A2H6K8K8_9APIC|nr:signal peptide containing protein, putative [Babesia ovata]GBE59335.1 signal peptide containing protein, putative [Babesia ovata]